MIGERILELRKQNHMTQFDLAKALNLSPSAIGMYEQGRRTPNVSVLIHLSKIFCVSVDSLIKEVD